MSSIGAIASTYFNTTSTNATIKNVGYSVLNITGVSTTVDYMHLYVNGGSNNTRSLVLQNGYGNVGIGIAAPSYKLHVNGTMGVSGATTFGSSLSVTGDIAASSNVNVTNQTKSKTFSINGGCTLEYDSTNKCVKFVF